MCDIKRGFQNTYGCKVAVQSDHKLLETIVRKPLLSAPKRLQRMMMHVQKYDLDVVYTPGKHMLLADTLGRVFVLLSSRSFFALFNTAMLLDTLVCICLICGFQLILSSIIIPRNLISVILSIFTSSS